MCHHSDCSCVCKDTPKPHKHAEVIKAWADGKAIQIKLIAGKEKGTWKDTTGHCQAWSYDREYRIKPEPKPDRIYYVNAWDSSSVGSGIFSDKNVAISKRSNNIERYTGTIQYTIDGETGKLKSVEIVSSS
jgi:hypothetical protein